jgi:hypothetical protein
VSTDGGTLGARTFVLCVECRGTDGGRGSDGGTLGARTFVLGVERNCVQGQARGKQGASKGQARGKQGASKGQARGKQDLCAKREQADSNNSG